MEAGGRKVFTLLVELRCNSFCTFCGRREIDEALVRTRRRLGLHVPARTAAAPRRYTLETATEALVQARSEGFDVLSIQGGEPTVFPELAALVAEARRLGFSFVGMVTNGRKLADRDYARALLEAGLDAVTISILGADAETHDALMAVPGAFDAMIAGLRNAAEIAEGMNRRVFVDANVITTAKVVDRLQEVVRVLAASGVSAAGVHLVNYRGELSGDPLVRDALRFDVRRLRPALAGALDEARRVGLRLHVADIPPCLHPTLDSGDLELLERRSRVIRHQFQAADYSEEHTALVHPKPECCNGCLVVGACPRLDAAYLPEQPGDALRPLTPATIGAAVDEALAGLDPTAADAASRLTDLERSITLLEAMARAPHALSAPMARVHEAMQDLMLVGASRRDEVAMAKAVIALLGLEPHEDHGSLPRLRELVGLGAAELARRTGALPADRAPGSMRLRFGGRFAVALDGEAGEAGEVAVRRVTPVLTAAHTRAERIARAVFLGVVGGPMRRAKRLRVTEDGLDADFGGGLQPLWPVVRRGAIALEH